MIEGQEIIKRTSLTMNKRITKYLVKILLFIVN